MRGDRAHISARSTHVLRLGNETYTWSDERSQGGKLDLPPSDERTLFAPSVDYVYRAAPCRDRGKPKTKGTVDGHPFVNYECQDALDGSTRTYYFRDGSPRLPDQGDDRLSRPYGDHVHGKIPRSSRDDPGFEARAARRHHVQPLKIGT